MSLLRNTLVLALAALGAGCARESATWRGELQAEDPHVQLVAAVALALERPRLAGAAIRVLVRHADDELAWDRAGARRGLEAIERARPELLVEYLVLKSRDRPEVDAVLLPVLERAEPALRAQALELVRTHAWEVSEALLEVLASQARRDPERLRALEVELDGAPEPPEDAERLAEFLASVREGA